MRRLRQNRGMSEAEAQQRIAAQSPQADKVKQATRVIANNGSTEALYAQLDAIWNELAATA
jgi:dephospho-CoA kinase